MNNIWFWRFMSLVMMIVGAVLLYKVSPVLGVLCWIIGLITGAAAMKGPP